MNKLLVGGGLVLAFAAGLGWHLSQKPALIESSAGTRSPLEFVPSDTAFLIANSEPLPSEVRAAWMEQLGSLGGMVEMKRQLLSTKLGEESKPVAQLARAVLDELEGDPAQWLERWGLDPGLKFAAYEVDGRPVFRIELSQPEAFQALISRIEEKSGKPLPVAEVAGQRYWRFVEAADSPMVAAMVRGGHLVLALLPLDHDPEQLAKVLGIDAIGAGQALQERLDALHKEFALSSFSTGYVDTRLLLARYAEAQIDPGDGEAQHLAATCSKEFDRVAARVPRLVFGYERFDAKHVDARMVVDLEDGLAAELMKSRAAMPGLAAADRSLVDFGFASNLESLLITISSQASAVVSTPFTCPALVDINNLAKETQAAVTNPMLFATAAAFSSIHVSASSIQLNTGVADQAPGFAGRLVIGSRSPQGLVAMLAQYAPPIASVQLKPDSMVRDIPAVPGMETTGPMAAVMNERSVAVSVGADQKQGLAEVLAAADDAPGPLLSVRYSGALLAQILAEAGTGDAAEIAEFKQINDAMARYYADHVDRIGMQIELTPRGMEIVQSMSAK